MTDAEVAAAQALVFRGWTEEVLLNYCRNTAKALGWLEYHTRYSIKSSAGFPDLVLVHERLGRVVFAELKREGKWPTVGRLTRGAPPRMIQGQDLWLRALLACPGVETYLWRPSDQAEIAEILQDGPRPGMLCVSRLEAFLGGSGGQGGQGAPEAGA